jgi:transporter family protein
MNWFFWAFLSAVFAGLTAVLAKAGVAGINSNLATAIRTTVVLVICWLCAAFTMKAGDLASLSRRTWLFLTLSGVATGVSWLCYFRALQLGPVSKVAPIDKLSVIVAIAVSMAVLGERLNLREGCGAGLIIAGALLLGWE